MLHTIENKSREASPVRYYVLHPSGMVEEKDTVRHPLRRDLLKEIVGGELEFVAAMYREKPATIIINDIAGSLNKEVNPKGQSQPNARATAIYWTAAVLGETPTSFEPLRDPMIHGTVVLVELDKREL